MESFILFGIPLLKSTQPKKMDPRLARSMKMDPRLDTAGSGYTFIHTLTIDIHVDY